MASSGVPVVMGDCGDIQLPAAPTIDLLDPTRTFSDPEMEPFTMTIAAESPATASMSSDSEVTSVVGPPAPPVVLIRATR